MTSRTTAPTAATTIIGGIAGQHNSIGQGDGQVVFPGLSGIEGLPGLLLFARR